MADLNPNPSSSSAPQGDGYPLESDDISTLLQTLLQSSGLPSSSPASLHASLNNDQLSALAAAEEFRRQFGGSAAFSDSSSGLDFPFRGDCYAPGENERSRSAFSGAIGDFDCETEKEQDASDAQRSTGPSRGSSKRTRGAEFHNLSEKRRRQRINEKMKALQKLIPNSNKTDKASMLDEAIEYLKQLQLQVQMLALRNGSTLQPFYIPGVMNSGQPSSTGIYFNGGEGMPGSSRGVVGSLTAQQELPVQTVYNHPSSDHKIFMSSPLEHGNLEYPFALEPPSSSNQCRPFNLTMPSKEVFGGSKLPQLHLDAGCRGDESSSGASTSINETGWDWIDETMIIKEEPF